MTDPSTSDQLALIELNGAPDRVVAGTFPEPQFRKILRRASPHVGEFDAIGIRTRPAEPSISVVTADSTVTVRDGLEVWTAPRDSEITVDVNGAQVVLMGPVHTVEGIKSAAESQGAELPDSYVLGLVYGRREVEDLNDGHPEIFVLKGSRFVAVGNDDNA